MSVTITGGDATTGPRVEAVPIVESKELWSDDWQISLDLEPVNCTVSSASCKAGPW
jgi:hypothetical protein